MYDWLLILHSITRWLVLVAAVLAVWRAWAGWRGGRDWTAADNQAGRWFTLSMDVQLLLGLILVGTSPLVQRAMADMGAAMGDTALRFWSVEHTTLMLVALILAHVGRARSRRATTPAAKHRAAAILYGLALLTVLMAIPWPFRAEIGRALLPFG